MPMDKFIDLKLVSDFVIRSAQKFPEKSAIIFEKERLTYSDLLEKASRLAQSLISSGVKKGDRVILMHENCTVYVVSYYGILLSGGVVVSINPDTKNDSLHPLFEELEPSAVIISSRSFNSLQKMSLFPESVKLVIINGETGHSLLNYSCPTVQFADIIKPANPDILLPALHEDDLAAIIYTSGSTGKPKGVMLSHKNIVANTRSICQYLQLTENDIQMVVLPFFYVMGKSLLNTHMAVGGTVVINNKFAFPAAVIKQMITENVTGFSGVPSTFAYLLHRSPLASSSQQLASLRYVSQAGGHMPKQIKLALRSVLPEQTKIFIMYGATEASARLTWLDPEHFSEKIDSIGKAIPDVTIKILDSDGSPLPPGQTGEIVAQGDNIMKGYWKNDIATRLVLDHNGYHTGDMGYMDSDGYVYVTGRRDNQLKVSGHRVDPQEIEDALMESGQLIEVAVIGVADQLMGNRLYGFAVQVNDKVTASGIIQFASTRLPRHKIPSEIFFTKILPKNPSGKTDRNQCLKIISEKINENSLPSNV